MVNDESAAPSIRIGEDDYPDHPERIGEFRILRLIGQGGMGRVYLAREAHPPRDVALKLMRGLDRGGQARFRREAELLAGLEHPGIARLYSAGETDFAGLRLPWLALEYVRGEDLLHYARSHSLDLRQRLLLLIDVCRAVHFAHGRGVIHRDLKPGNIVVGEDGRPRILDFGIARLRDDAEGMTQQGQVLGTIPYMSPEQLSGRSHAVDVRSDVYALGVIAYELVAQRLPHPRLSTSTVLEALEIVRKETPPRLASLAPRARGDLDLVVMKALASEPERRYSSAAEFAADLERVLDHRPVEARAPTVGYLVSRFVRRHRALSAAVAVVAMVLVGAAVVSLQYALAEAQARRLAEVRAAEAQAVSDFVGRMLTSADPDNAIGEQVKVVDVLEQAVRELDGDNLPASVAARLQFLLGRTYLNLGAVDRGEALALSALDKLDDANDAASELRDMLAHDLAAIANARADYPTALQRIDALLEQTRALAPETEIHARITRAHAIGMAGRHEEAIAALRELSPRADQLLGEDHRFSLTVRHNLAVLLQEQGRLDEALVASRDVLQRRQAVFGPNHPETLYSLNQLAAVHHRLGDSAQAEPLMRQVIEARTRVLGPQHPSTLTSQRNLAVLAIQTGRPQEGLALLEGLARDWEATRGAESPQALSISQLRSYVLQDLGRFEEAEQVLRRTVDVQIAAGGPSEPLLLAPRNDLGMVLMELGRAPEARAEFEGLMAWAEAMLDTEDPYLAIFRSNYGACLVALGQWQPAREALERSRAVLGRVMGPQHVRTRTAGERLLKAYQGLGLRAEAAALEAELAASG